jgi:hypothetical protein
MRVLRGLILRSSNRWRNLASREARWKREILRVAQDDSKKEFAHGVILSRCGEESRRMLSRPALGIARASMAPGVGAAQDVDLRAAFYCGVFFQKTCIDLLECWRFAAAPSIACGRAAVVARV